MQDYVSNWHDLDNERHEIHSTMLDYTTNLKSLRHIIKSHTIL